MTPQQLRDARAGLGLTAAQLARAVGVASERTVTRWEAGQRAIPGPVERLIGLMQRDPAALADLLERPA